MGFLSCCLPFVFVFLHMCTINYFHLIVLLEAMATDQPDTTSTVRTSTSYRSTALKVNKNRLMYRALYQQICSSDQLLHTSTNIAKTLTQREKRLREKKTQNVPNQNSIGSASRRDSTERRKTKKNLFCVFMRTDFLLWVFYTERRKK